MTSLKALVGKRELAFKFLALCCLVASLYHLCGVLDDQLREGYAWQRHAVFSGLNLLVAYFVVQRTWYFVPFLIGLVVQQLSGHGQNFLNSMTSSSAVSAIDVAVIVFMPILLIAYVVDLMAVGRS